LRHRFANRRMEAQFKAESCPAAKVRFEPRAAVRRLTKKPFTAETSRAKATQCILEPCDRVWEQAT
jgi:hypothetical protein